MKFGLISEKGIIENKFSAQFPEKFEYTPNFNISLEDNCIILTSKSKYEFSMMKHGLIPFWSKEERVLFEAAIEGKELRKEMDHIKPGIILSPDFRKPIRSQRCLLPVDYFVVESKQ